MKLKELLFGVLATLLCLSVIELLARLMLPRPGFMLHQPYQLAGLLIPHQIRNYAYRPNFFGRINTREYEIDVAINELGLRDDPITPNRKVDVLAAGDSYTVGWGVQAKDAWPAQLERYINSTAMSSRRVRVVNGGVSGYSLSQVNSLVEEFTLSFQPKIVVIGVYSSRYWRLSNPYVYFNGQAVVSDKVPRIRSTQGGFLHSGISSDRLRSFHFWLMENFYLGAHLVDISRNVKGKLVRHEQGKNITSSSAEEKLLPLLEELNKIRNLLNRRNIGLVVLLVNHQEVDGTFDASEKEYNAIVQSYCRDLGITVFSPIPFFESLASEGAAFRIGGDPHWSKRAHALVGQELGRYLLEQNWIRTSLLDTKEMEKFRSLGKRL